MTSYYKPFISFRCSRLSIRGFKTHTFCLLINKTKIPLHRPRNAVFKDWPRFEQLWLLPGFSLLPISKQELRSVNLVILRIEWACPVSRWFVCYCKIFEALHLFNLLLCKVQISSLRRNTFDTSERKFSPFWGAFDSAKNHKRQRRKR